MAISTYSELKTALANWLDRYDLSADMVSDLILAGEIRLYDDIKIRAMEAAMSETLAANAQTVTYPSDCLNFKGAVYITEDDARTPLVQQSEEWIKNNYPEIDSGKPQYFYLSSDDKLTFNCKADQEYTISATYYKRLTLSDSNTTNWFLTNYPMVVLYAAILEAMVLVEDDPRRYEAMYEEQLRRIVRRENSENFAAATRTFRQVSLTDPSPAMGTHFVNWRP